MENIMKIEEVNSCLDKFKLYKEQEQLFIEDITNCLNSIKNSYYSNNSKKIDNLNLELLNKLNVISNIHTNNVTVIEKSIGKYRSAEVTAKKLFEDIETR